MNVDSFKPNSIENCLIDKTSLESIIGCDFSKSNILFYGKAGVGKTILSKLIKNKYPSIKIIENIQTPDFIERPCIATTTNNISLSEYFDKVITIYPLNKISLLKELSNLVIGYESKNNLFYSINLYYPNINKILNYYINEN